MNQQTYLRLAVQIADAGVKRLCVRACCETFVTQILCSRTSAVSIYGEPDEKEKKKKSVQWSINVSDMSEWLVLTR